MGLSVVTGSMVVKSLNNAIETSIVGNGVVAGSYVTAVNYLRGGNGSYGTPSIQIGSDDDGFYHDTAGGNAGILVKVGNVAEEFGLLDGGHFHAEGDITAYSGTITSDIRLKENIKLLENNLDKILELKPSSFRWKVREQQDDIGLIAQEVESIIPMIVKDSISIGRTKEFLDGDTHKVIDYAKITTYLIGAVQEQQKQIDELKKKLEVT